MTAAFLPDGQDLYIVAVDAEGNIHVLQYDPEGAFPLLPLPFSTSKVPPFTLTNHFLTHLILSHITLQLTT